MRVLVRKPYGFLVPGEYDVREVRTRSMRGIGLFKPGAVMPADVLPYQTWQRLQWMDFIVEVADPAEPLGEFKPFGESVVVASSAGVRVVDANGRTIERRPA